MAREEIVARMGLDKSGYVRGLRDSERDAAAHFQRQERRWNQHAATLNRAVSLTARVGTAAIGGMG